MIATLRPKLKKPEIFYPERDEDPLGETDFHAHETIGLFEALRSFFKADRDIYVAMDNFLYYKKDHPKAVISPDVYVVKGVEKKKRRTYKVWEEGGHVPAVVFEITSASSKTLDLGKKKTICEELGVKEYFLFDPLGEYLSPVLRGFRLQAGVYVEILPDADSNLLSEELRLKFSSRTPGLLRVIDPRTGKMVPRYEEMDTKLDAAEAEVTRLREELNRLKK